MHNVINAQMLGSWSPNHGGLEGRQNGNNNRNGQNNGPDTGAFTIVNGRIFTPGLGIILAVGQGIERRVILQLTRRQAPALYAHGRRFPSHRA
jgi:hypothetical protein